ncbi:MAG: preprotein translocase subunit SecG [Anaerolineae bacterium]|nr:preprotein translocase subunit SecG [Anaerolineae bacterium]
MLTYFYIMQIIIAVTLITLVLLQAREGGLGSIFGGEGGIYKTRRGVEKTLFQATIGLSIAFFILAFVTVLISR